MLEYRGFLERHPPGRGASDWPEIGKSRFYHCAFLIILQARGIMESSRHERHCGSGEVIYCSSQADDGVDCSMRLR